MTLIFLFAINSLMRVDALINTLIRQLYLEWMFSVEYCVLCIQLLTDLVQCPSHDVCKTELTVAPMFAQFRGWRCIHESKCRELNFMPEEQPRQYWKLRDDGLCELECPAGQMENRTDRHHCVRCVGKCPKGVFQLRSVMWIKIWTTDNEPIFTARCT